MNIVAVIGVYTIGAILSFLGCFTHFTTSSSKASDTAYFTFCVLWPIFLPAYIILLLWRGTKNMWSRI